ncbi:hypothetical protein CRYUN_Cryun10bG0068100 [Craigia yunnanensis]
MNFINFQCWLLMEDCMCSKVKPCSLWPGIKFWLYMHPKDFLMQNNTGKLLWQVFGVQAVTLCLYGISEDEGIMWNYFWSIRRASKVCLGRGRPPLHISCCRCICNA